MHAPTQQALIFNIRYEAKEIISIELRPARSDVLFDTAEAGAHIDLHLANGLVRSYSLTNPGDLDRYVIAVLNDKHSRGGSSYVHQQLRVGQSIEISTPRNNFSLNENAEYSVLLAGGIGITPIYSMLQRLLVLGRSVELIYCARNREEAAYIEHIKALTRHTEARKNLIAVHYHFDEEKGAPPDLTHLLAGRPLQTHFYCCGPGLMLNAYEKACKALGQVHIHLERFSAAKELPQALTESYSVELKRSGKTVHVPSGVSLLDALLQAGLKPDFSCREGVCGSCEIKVISGEVDHRDQILTKQEKAANKSMMICVSSGRSGHLVLDA
jgi:ferredoxin-NADP reductase